MNSIHSILSELVKTHSDEIDRGAFEPIISKAIENNVLEELLCLFDKTKAISIPPTVVYACLYKRYVASSAKLSPREKEKLKNKTYALINKQQVLLFKAMFD